MRLSSHHDGGRSDAALIYPDAHRNGHDNGRPPTSEKAELTWATKHPILLIEHPRTGESERGRGVSAAAFDGPSNAISRLVSLVCEHDPAFVDADKAIVVRRASSHGGRAARGRIPGFAVAQFALAGLPDANVQQQVEDLRALAIAPPVAIAPQSRSMSSRMRV